MSDIVPPWEEARKRLQARRGQTAHAASEEELGGRAQINSGRFWHSKRDRAKYDFLFENRQTDGKTITIDARELAKIAKEAVFEHLLPAMRLDFSTHHEDWVLIRRRDFEEQNEYIAQLQALLKNERKTRLAQIQPDDSV